MSFPSPAVIGKFLTCAGVAAVLAACGGSHSSLPQPPASTLSYSLEQTIAVPGYTAACSSATCSFDISFDDPNAAQMYFSDRTNKGVSVINTATNTYVGTAGGGSFVGINATNSNGSGPNGVLSIGGGILFAGDGNSTVKVLSAATLPGTPLATITTVNPTTTGTYPTVCGGTGTPSTGLANNRADEMGYDPRDHEILVVNDAACPPFATFISTVAPYGILGSIAFPTAGTNGSPGAEQTQWDPVQNMFLTAIPATTANPGGEVDVIDPLAHTIVKVLNAGVGTCNPNGLALGPNETAFLGCSGIPPGAPSAEMVTINAATGALINTIAGLGGCDEVWYEPISTHFYGGCSNNPTGPSLVIANSSGALIQSVTTSTGAHSVTADSSTNHVLMPERGGAAGPNGVGVYAQ